MCGIERFTTSSVKADERLAYWNRLTNETYPGTMVDRRDESFEAEMLRWTLGDLTMIRPRSRAALITRKPTGNEPERVVLHLQHSGRSRHEQWGRVAEIGVGDFSLCSAGSAYRLDLEAHEFLVVEMPRAALERRLPALNDLISQPIPGSTPSGRLLHNFILSLWHQGDQSHADPEWQRGVANVLLDLIGLAAKGVEFHAGERRTLREKVLTAVEANMGNPEFCSTQLATELGVSIRTVQNIFAAMGTTPSGYILAQRLTRAAELLTIDNRLSITTIAHELGFSESGYFARCFRQKFGRTPTQWRAQH